MTKDLSHSLKTVLLWVVILLSPMPTERWRIIVCTAALAGYALLAFTNLGETLYRRLFK